MKNSSGSRLRTLLASLSPGGEDVEEGSPALELLAGPVATGLILGAIGALALFLRIRDYALAPGRLGAPDEYSQTWAGMQVLQGHAPAGVSALAAYGPGGNNVQLFGRQFHLVAPWLDQPPLAGIPGAISELASGVRQFGEISPQVMRRPAIALGVLTVILGYYLARRLLPPVPAIFAGFLLAVEPGLVLLSRLSLGEALLAPILLGAVLLATPVVPETTRPGSAGAGPAPEQAPRSITLGALCALCFLAPLVGMAGVTVAASASALLLSRRLRNEALVVGIAGAAGVLVFLLFGILLGGGLFAAVWSEKALNGGSIGAAMTFVTTSIGAGTPMLDGWYLFSWAALAYLAGNAKRRHRNRAVLWPVALYIGVVTPFLAPQGLTLSGWFRLPILPLLLVGAFSAVYAAVREGQLLVPALALLSAGLWSMQWLFPAPFRPGGWSILVLAAVALLPMAVAEVQSRGRSRDAALGIWGLLALLVLAGDTVLAYNLAGLAGSPGLTPQ